MYQTSLKTVISIFIAIIWNILQVKKWLTKVILKKLPQATKLDYDTADVLT